MAFWYVLTDLQGNVSTFGLEAPEDLDSDLDSSVNDAL